jgi:phage gpG-like protein
LPPGLRIEINTVGIRLRAREFQGVAARAGNLTPIWPLVDEVFENEARRRFETNGYGKWKPHHPNTEKRWGPHPLLRLTNNLYDALTSSTDDSRRIHGLRTYVFGIKGNSDVFYGKFHQGGTKKMPRRPILPGRTSSAVLQAQAIIGRYIAGGAR